MMADMGETELTPMVAVDPFHLPQSEPLALTVNNKEKESSDLNEFRQEEEEEEEEEEVLGRSLNCNLSEVSGAPHVSRVYLVLFFVNQ